MRAAEQARVEPMHRLAWSLARLIGVAAVVCTATAATSATVTAGTPRCAAARLVVWLDGPGNRMAGSTYYKLELTNLSGNACTLRGYPGVSAVSLAGRRLGSAASRNDVHPPRQITLRSGATATAVLQIVDAHNFPRAACHPTTAAGLRVFPPNQTASRLVPFPFLACARSGPQYLSVEVVQ
jgi:hypothetical protein